MAEKLSDEVSKIISYALVGKRAWSRFKQLSK